MKRALLPLAMILSLWPAGLIAASFATGSSSPDDSKEVTVQAPPDPSDPKAPPKEERVQLKVDGETYSCPRGTWSRLDPIDRKMASIELKLRAARRELRPLSRRLKQLDKLYPGKTAPAAIADEYNGVLRNARSLNTQERRLVAQYNAKAAQHNEILDSDCF